MPRSQQAFLSFSAGVLSPRLTLRADSEKYAKALQTGENWIVTPQGGITLRNGSEFIGTNLDQTKESRIFTHSNGGNKSDFIMMVNLPTGEVWKDDVKIGPGSFDFQYQSAAELEDIYHTNKEGLSIFVHPLYPPDYVNITEAEVISKELLLQIEVPLIRYEDEKSPGNDAGMSTIYALTFVNGAVDSWIQGSRYFVGYGNQTASSGFPEPLPLQFLFSLVAAENITNLTTALRSMFYLQNELTHTITIVEAAGVYTITITGPFAGRELIIIPIVTTDLLFNVDQTGDTESGEEPAWSDPYVVENGAGPNFFQCIQPHKGATTNEPGVGATFTDFWLDLGTTAPSWYVWQHENSNLWLIDRIYGQWDRGFPKVAAFREQRLLMMGNKDKPMGVWGSRIGVYTDFVGGVNDADPFFFELDSDNSPQIQWATSTQTGLIIGTSGGDWIVTAEKSLGPSDIDANQQNAARSAQGRSITLNNEIFYIEQGGEKLRMTRYVRNSLGLSSMDVSLLSEKLCTPGIKRVVLMQTPEVLIACLRDDGSLVVLSYNNEQEVAAWSRIDGQDTIYDLAVIYSTLTSTEDLYLVINRPPNFYLEKMPYPAREFEDDLSIQGVVLMDSWVAGAFVPGPPTIPTEITGLDHLEGRTVAILLDDAFGGEHVVVDGAIPLIGLETAPTSFAVGLLYTGTAKTFQPVNGNPRGVIFGTKSRWNKVHIRLLDSALPLINGDRPADRRPSTPQLTADTIREGVNDAKINSVGWDDGVVTIVQDRPYPTHALGIFGEFGVENA